LRLTSLIGMLLTLITGCSTSFMERLCDFEPRPQHPKERPYIVRDVTIDGGAPGVRLAGELTMPEGKGPFPGIVLVSGSAVVNRDSKILGHKFYLVLADYLTRRGYAIYRHDDRGFGKSTGDTWTATDADFALDSAAALKWLRTQDKIDPNRAGYIGHSQGGLKAPLAAAIEKPNFMVFLAGGVQPNTTILLQQVQDFGTAAGLSKDVLKKQDEDLRKIFRILRASATVEAASGKIVALGLEEGLSRRQAEKVADAYATPFLLALVRWDDELFGDLDQKLAQLIRSFDGPILSLHPELDFFVRAEPNASLTESLLTHPASKVIVLPGLNHMFQPAVTGTIEETCETETTFDPVALQVTGDWLDEINNE